MTDFKIGDIMKKRALISVYNKDNLVGFAKELVEKYDYEIVSTGATYSLLKDNDIKSIEVKDVTGVSEMLGGKVKTLHPMIHAGILANISNPSEAKELESANISAIDMVVVNFYPFVENADEDACLEDLVKNIDIGGPCMLRAAAKNFERVTAVSNPCQYNSVLDELASNNGSTSIDFRKELALDAFKLTSEFDATILNTLSEKFVGDEEEAGNYFSIITKKQGSLRYGENPHQAAAIYEGKNLLDYEVLNGKELSYNNILDMTAATNIVSEFYDVCAAVIVKHNAPCGVALGADINDAYLKAFDCDPISAFGGIVAFSQVVNETVAKHLSSVFLEVIIAPDYTPKALEMLKEKKNLRLIKLNTPLQEYKNFLEKDVRLTPYGTLVQQSDVADLNKDTFNVVTKLKPTAEMIEDMIFAWKVVKHSKSNAIVVAKDFKAIGIAQGQTSRIDAVEIALNKACDGSKDAVMASDGFFPAIDNIQAAAQGRIAAVIQPGGSIKDKDVIDAANKYNIVMITTGVRHFKH